MTFEIARCNVHGIAIIHRGGVPVACVMGETFRWAGRYRCMFNQENEQAIRAALADPKTVAVELEA
jgi:hypothetical protein